MAVEFRDRCTEIANKLADYLEARIPDMKPDHAIETFKIMASLAGHVPPQRPRLDLPKPDNDVRDGLKDSRELVADTLASLRTLIRQRPLNTEEIELLVSLSSGVEKTDIERCKVALQSLRTKGLTDVERSGMADRIG